MKPLLQRCTVWAIAVTALIGIPAVAQAEQSAAVKPAAAETRPIPVFFNDEPVTFNVDPIMESGTTLVEFRPIFEKLGLAIDWDSQTKTVTGSKEGLTVELAIGSKVAEINGEEKPLSAAPKLVDERTVIPLRFVGEAAGSFVSWDGNTRMIRLYRIAPEQPVTTTNRVMAEGKVPAGTYWVRFDILNEKTQEFSVDYARPANGTVRHELYLPHGAGSYKIDIYHTKKIDKDTIDYERNAGFSVTNEGNSGIHADATSTDNSRIRLFGEPDPSVKTVIVFASHNETGEEKRIFRESANGRLDTELYLNLGQGEYTVAIYTTDESPESSVFERVVLFKSYTIVNNDSRDPDLVPSEQVESEHPEIVALAEQITEGKQSDGEKSRAIHDWVTANIDYDAKTILAGGDRNDSALQTLQGKLSDCDGYARLNAALHRAAGIKARIVIGTVIDPESGETWEEEGADELNHAWNEVFADGRWIVQDPTWNAGYVDPDIGQFVRHVTSTYYDPSPAQFALDHRAGELDYKYE